MSWIADHHKPLLISGPCSAETEDQVTETAVRLQKTVKFMSSEQVFGNLELDREHLKE